MASHILSELCSTCHTAPPKYRCPGCSTKSCSLTCVKRHKARAGCSGLRAASSFVKKSKLLTTSGFDHDYNFMKDIETKVSREESAALETLESPLAENPWRGRRKGKFWSIVAGMELNIVSAPFGMSRDRENESRVGHKSGEIMWTVEWLLEDNSRCLTTVSNTTALETACGAALRGMSRSRDKSTKPGKTAGKKRKRSEDYKSRDCSRNRSNRMIHDDPRAANRQSQIASITQEPFDTSDSVTREPEVGREPDVKGLPEVTIDDIRDPESQQTSQAELEKKDIENETGASEVKSPESDPARHERLSAKDPDESDSHLLQVGASEAESPQSLVENTFKSHPDVGASATTQPRPSYVYLVMVRTIGPKLVLIPIDKTQTLKEALRKQTILEFPTFQVLNEPLVSSTSRFMLAADYLAKVKNKPVNMSVFASEDSKDESDEEVIPNKDHLLEVIRRDTGSVTV